MQYQKVPFDTRGTKPLFKYSISPVSCVQIRLSYSSIFHNLGSMDNGIQHRIHKFLPWEPPVQQLLLQRNSRMKFNVIDNIRIVLVETTHPGNIGATARAMRAMRHRNLYLVRPKIFPSAEATVRAAGADDVLAQARVVDSLADAVADCTRVIATSARERSIPWPVQTPWECAGELVNIARKSPVALVFGRESSGLSNAELELCNSVVHIPTDTGFTSLNIASAVQIICYEIMKVCAGPADHAADTATWMAPVDQSRMQLFYQCLEQCMIDIGFLDPVKPRRLMRRMKRLFNRAQPDQGELNILRGFLAAIQEILKTRTGSNNDPG